VNREEVIRLAREAGFDVQYLFGTDEVCVPDYNYWTKNPDIGQDVITHIVERFTNLVAAAEREACAKVCEDIPLPQNPPELTHLPTIERCVNTIRARGNPGIKWEVEP
jgi:hypothetical protein